jgi:hypothetical protein
MSILNTTTPAPGSPWTAEYLAFVLPLTAEAVLKPGGRPDIASATHESRTEWAWIQTAQRLTNQYGETEALNRINGYRLPAEFASGLYGRAC